MAQQRVQAQPKRRKPGSSDGDSDDLPAEVNEISLAVSKSAEAWLRQNP